MTSLLIFAAGVGCAFAYLNPNVRDYVSDMWRKIIGK